MPPTQLNNPNSQFSPTVLRFSPLNHLAVGLLTLCILVPVLNNPLWFGWMLIIPAFASLYIARTATIISPESLRIRSVLSSRTLQWEAIAGIRFPQHRWGRLRLKDQTEVRLPTVTFATLPTLATASGGRITDPYSAHKSRTGLQ
ncbi:MAG: PH domain-containing protein [Mycobacteriaceae bacterium]